MRLLFECQALLYRRIDGIVESLESNAGTNVIYNENSRRKSKEENAQHNSESDEEEKEKFRNNDDLLVSGSLDTVVAAGRNWTGWASTLKPHRERQSRE